MFKKQPYFAPETEIVPLHTEGAILTGSGYNATAIAISFLDEESFDDFFIL